MEEADNSGTPIVLSSWDIKQAFASLSYNVLALVWHLLGVPWEMAEYLVSLDKDDSTVIRSPWAEDAFASNKYTAFRQYKPRPEVRAKGPGARPAKFSRQRGVAQGDVRSPHNWNAFYDILLCALHALESADW